ncbi:MAG: DUF3048 domain-containing protein [Eubacteriales bacterium]|nr:DUF3048 domain-containing protein [Eubacteriales bacterium]
MKKNKIALLLIGTMTASMLFAGCGKKKDDKSTEATPPSVSIDQVATMSDAGDIPLAYKEGYVISELTGEWIDESLENQRPICMMINNIIDAMPQSGISKADLTFEILVEGGVTRYLCVFKDYASLEKVGPVRSARHYYVRMNDFIDGIYAHYGWSDYARQLIEQEGTNNINGLYDDKAYYRDNSRYAPHNVYTDGARLKDAVERNGYRTTYKDGLGHMFEFNLEDTPLANNQTANKIMTAYNGSPSRWFEYNEEDQRYYRFQYNEKQMDVETQEQLSYKNVIVMFANYEPIDGYLLHLDWYSGGTGYYFTDGEYKEIKWENVNEEQVRFFDQDGKLLKMNPGNTFITVFEADKPQNITIE